MIDIVVTQDLPPIFKTTQTHVNGILAHFRHYLTRHHQQHQQTTTTKEANIVVYHPLENINEIILYLQSNVDHLVSIENNSNFLNKFLLLSKDV